MKTRWAALIMLAMVYPSSAAYHKLGGFHPDQYVRDVAVAGPLAVVASSYDGVHILDISDPSDPTVLLNHPTPGPAWRATCVDSRAYVLDWWEGLFIFDLSNPAAPTFMGQGPPMNHGNAIVVESDYAYVGSNSGLRIYDVANPESVTLVSTLALSDAVYSLQKDGNRMYAAGSGAGLLILSVTYPQVPYLAYTIPTNDRAYDAHVVDDIAFVADGWEGLLAIDISDPSHPIYHDRVDLRGAVHYVEVEGSVAYVTDRECGFHVLDVSDPADIVRTGCFNTPGSAGNFARQDQQVFIADEYVGLSIVDIAEPTIPFLVGAYRHGAQVGGFAVIDDCAYLADGEEGLILVDIHDPAAPHYVESVNIDGRECCLAVEGSRAVCGTDYFAGGNVEVYEILADQSIVHAGSHLAYGAVSSATLQNAICYASITEDEYRSIDCVDISNPHIPQALSRTQVTEYLVSISVSGEYVFAALRHDGVRIYDFTNKSAPIPIGYLDTPGEASTIEVFESYAYVADGPAGLQVIDCADPENPKLLTTCQPRMNGDIRAQPAVHGGLLYITDNNWNTIHIYSLTDPANPALVGEYAWNFATHALCPTPDYLFTGHFWDGFSVLDPQGVTGVALAMTDRPTFAIRGITPNPVTAAAAITFAMPQESALCDLAIYDPSGRRLKTLISATLNGGDHHVTWMGKDDAGCALPAGIYFCRIRSGSRQAAQRIVLVR